jgi:hypothetical protein
MILFTDAPTIKEDGEFMLFYGRAYCSKGRLADWICLLGTSSSVTGFPLPARLSWCPKYSRTAVATTQLC